MINRRLIRVKILQALYSYYQSGDTSLEKVEKELLFSIQKTYDLYHYLFLLLIDINRFAKSKIDFNKSKFVPTEEDLNPVTKFVDNKIIVQLKENERLKNYLNERKMSWTNHLDLIKVLFKNISESEDYKSYMASEERSYDADKKILINILENILNESEDLYATLEEQSIFWNDNIDFIISMIVKTIKKLKIGDDSKTPLMPKFKNDEDKEFVTELLHKTILHQAEYREIITQNIKNWDIDRLAFLDIIILQLALTELYLFPEIPVKVTINEYIEISKYYSTEKSSTFINGILDKLVKNLKKDNQIVKRGRGLIGDIEEDTNS